MFCKKIKLTSKEELSDVYFAGNVGVGGFALVLNDKNEQRLYNVNSIEYIIPGDDWKKNNSYGLHSGLCEK